MWKSVCQIILFFAAVFTAQLPPAGAQQASSEPYTGTEATVETPFLTKYPHLAENIYREPKSPIELGFSLGLLGLMKDRMLFTLNFFQVHWVRPRWDLELFSFSYGQTTANPDYVQSNHFIVRSIPKFRISRGFSIGPLIGYEYVSFPKVISEIRKSLTDTNSYKTKPVPFSSRGLIYGLGASQTFSEGKDHKIKISQTVFQQTYRTDESSYGWKYYYNHRHLNDDPSPIKAGIVVQLEVGVYF